MKGTGKLPMVGLALAAGVATVVLGVSARWPIWLWAVPALVAVVLAVLLASARAPSPYGPAEPEPDPEPLPESQPQPEPEELPWKETRVVDVPLPSGAPDYDFLFSATVWWRHLPNTTGLVHADPASLAVGTVLARAQEVTAREDPGRPDLVMHRLNGWLGTQSCDSSGLVEAMGGRVELRLSEDDRARLGKLSEVRKTEVVWEHERRYEQNRRAYLGDDVLSSPGSAVVWWLARHDDKIREAVDMIGPLAQLAAAANDEAVDSLYEHLTPRPKPQGVPFLDDVAPRRRADDKGDDEDPTGSAGPEGPGGPHGPRPGPPVVGPLNQLLDDVDLEQRSPEREVYAHRVAKLTDAIGRPDQARLIRESLRAAPEAALGGQPNASGAGTRFTKSDGLLNGFAADGRPPAMEG
ncbi:hypothetical protein ACFWIQ_37875 [Kitasatospora sp. NPDC127059]|uniref:hypothetical protein n=1 Tax=unclassified Kitasatospora TaxID=2633591 RepID=UPI003654897A